MKDPVNRDFDEIGQEALRVLLVVADGEMLLSLTGLALLLRLGRLDSHGERQPGHDVMNV